MIRRVQVEYVTDGTVYFRVAVRGDEGRLRGALDIGRVLVPLDDGSVIGGLRYQYAR